MVPNINLFYHSALLFSQLQYLYSSNKSNFDNMITENH